MTTLKQFDLMLDIETLGIGPNAAFFEIGYSTFDPLDPDSTYSMGSIEFDLLDVILEGGEVDKSAIDWWRTQPKPKLTDQVPVRIGLQTLSMFIKQANVRYVWANSPMFDCRILESMYLRLGMEIPWTYKQLMDHRTARNILKMAGIDGPVMQETTHRGDQDSMDQAVWLSAALSELMERARRV